jgi:hypothetical protein
MKEYNPTKYTKGQQLLIAAKCRDLKAVKKLLASGPISREDRGMIVQSVAVNGYFEILNALLASGPISQEDKGFAVYNATANRSPAASSPFLQKAISHWQTEALLFVPQLKKPNIIL